MFRWWKKIRAKYDASVQDKLILTIPTATFVFWVLMTFFNCLSFYQQTRAQFIDDGITISENLLPQLEFRSKMHYQNFDSANVGYITKRNKLNEMGTIINTDTPLAILEREHGVPVTEQDGYTVLKIKTDRGIVFEFTRELKDWEKRQYGFKFYSVGISAERMYGNVLRQILTFVGIGLVLIASQVLVIILFAKTITKPLQQVTEGVDRLTGDPMSHRDVPVPTGDEVGRLAQKINEMVRRIREYEDHQEQHRALVAIGQTASKVAHDIRSPLSSIETAVRLLQVHTDQNTEANDGMNLLRLASKRLAGIADDLLKKYRGVESEVETFSIHEILDELLGEHLIPRFGKEVELQKKYYSSALFITGSRSGISRAFGNIIKNALEAMEGRCGSQLTIQTQLADKAVLVSVIDNGPGIPADALKLILEGRPSSSKAGGYGIGTQVARDTVKQHGGKILVKSTANVGTVFTIELQAADRKVLPPTISEVAIPYSGGDVIVLDDDDGMREQWRIVLRQQGLSCKTFASWEDYQKEGGTILKESTFIVDYDFKNSSYDGLTVIRELYAAGHSHLVLATAEYWRPQLRDAALKMGLLICPKPLPKIVVQSQSPIPKGVESGRQGIGPTVLVIDDDPAIRLCWKAQRQLLGIGDLKLFATMEECENNALDYGAIDLAFIDKHIEGTTWSIDQIISHLKQQGVGRVWIASGDAAEFLHADPKCAAADGIVAGKMPKTLEDYSSPQLLRRS